MPLGRFAPCANCTCTQGDACEIYTDTFDTLDNWTVSTGTWSIDTGKAKCTTSNSKLICNTQHTTNRFAVRVTVSVTNENDEARLYINGGSHYIEMQFSSIPQGGQIRLVEASTGNIYAEYSGDIINNKTTTFMIASDGTTITGFYDIFLGAFCSFKLALTSNEVAIGTGNVTGEVKFDDFRILYHVSDNAKCQRTADICQYSYWGNTSGPMASSSFNISKPWTTTWNFDGQYLYTTGQNQVATYNVKHPGDPDSVLQLNLSINILSANNSIALEFPTQDVRIVFEITSSPSPYSTTNGTIKTYVAGLLYSTRPLFITTYYIGRIQKTKIDYYINFDVHNRLIGRNNSNSVDCTSISPPLVSTPTEFRFVSGASNTGRVEILTLDLGRQNARFYPNDAKCFLFDPEAYRYVPRYFALSTWGWESSSKCPTCSVLDGTYILEQNPNSWLGGYCYLCCGAYSYTPPTNPYLTCTTLRTITTTSYNDKLALDFLATCTANYVSNIAWGTAEVFQDNTLTLLRQDCSGWYYGVPHCKAPGAITLRGYL